MSQPHDAANNVFVERPSGTILSRNQKLAALLHIYDGLCEAQRAIVLPKVVRICEAEQQLL